MNMIALPGLINFKNLVQIVLKFHSRCLRNRHDTLTACSAASFHSRPLEQLCHLCSPEVVPLAANSIGHT